MYPSMFTTARPSGQHVVSATVPASHLYFQLHVKRRGSAEARLCQESARDPLGQEHHARRAHHRPPKLGVKLPNPNLCVARSVNMRFLLVLSDYPLWADQVESVGQGQGVGLPSLTDAVRVVDCRFTSPFLHLPRPRIQDSLELCPQGSPDLVFFRM